MSGPIEYSEEYLYQQKTGMPHVSLVSGNEEDRCRKPFRLPPTGFEADHKSQRTTAPCFKCMAYWRSAPKPSYTNDNHVATGVTISYFTISLFDRRWTRFSRYKKHCCWYSIADCTINWARTKAKNVIMDGPTSGIEVSAFSLGHYTSSKHGCIRPTEGLFLVYDVTSKSSFEAMLYAYREIRKHKNERGLYNLPICILGDQCDRTGERQVSTEQGLAIARDLGCHFVEVSNETGVTVTEAFEEFTRVIQEHYNTETVSHCRSKSHKKQVLHRPIGVSKFPTQNERLAKEWHWTTLIQAAQHSRTGELLWLLTTRRNLNLGSSINYAVYSAAAKGYRRIVGLLLRCGAAINGKGQAGMTPLQIAVVNNHIDVVRLLVDKGALLEELSPYGTALHAAASLGRLEIARLLLRSYAHVNAFGGPYGTPLQAAITKGDLGMTRLLLDWDAWIYLRGLGGDKPIEVAAYYGHVEIVKLLLERGANISTIPSVIGGLGIEIDSDDDSLSQLPPYPGPSREEILSMLREAEDSRRAKALDTWRKDSHISTSSRVHERSVAPEASARFSRSDSEATIAVPEGNQLSDFEKGIDWTLPEEYNKSSSNRPRCIYLRLKVMLTKLIYPISVRRKGARDPGSKCTSRFTFAASNIAPGDMIRRSINDMINSGATIIRLNQEETKPYHQGKDGIG